MMTLRYFKVKCIFGYYQPILSQLLFAMARRQQSDLLTIFFQIMMRPWFYPRHSE